MKEDKAFSGKKMIDVDSVPEGTFVYVEEILPVKSQDR